MRLKITKLDTHRLSSRQWADLIRPKFNRARPAWRPLFDPWNSYPNPYSITLTFIEPGPVLQRGSPGDVDNLAKPVIDALTMLRAWHDDSLVQRLEVRKVQSQKARTLVCDIEPVNSSDRKCWARLGRQADPYRAKRYGHRPWYWDAPMEPLLREGIGL